MTYTTIVLVVNTEDAERTRRLATGGGATLFSADVPGVSVDALTAGADPQSWDPDTRG
jgi:hypothetical protein